VLSEMQITWVKGKAEDLRPIATSKLIYQLDDENDWTDIVQNGNKGGENRSLNIVGYVPQ